MNDSRLHRLHQQFRPPRQVFEFQSLDEGYVLDKRAFEQMTPNVAVLDGELNVRMAPVGSNLQCIVSDNRPYEAQLISERHAPRTRIDRVDIVFVERHRKDWRKIIERLTELCLRMDKYNT